MDTGILEVFGKGLLLGLSIAAPVGAIGVLCIRRTLAYGWRNGLATGLGAATADGFYGAVAALGLTAISSFLTGASLWIKLGGGLFLLWLAYRTAVAPVASPSNHENTSTSTTDSLSSPTITATSTTTSINTVTSAPNTASAYFSSVALTFTNPSTILSFVAIFGSLGISSSGGLWLVVGVFLGSAAWWLMLSSVVSIFRSRVTPGILVWVNRGSGLILAAFGLLALVSLAFG